MCMSVCVSVCHCSNSYCTPISCEALYPVAGTHQTWKPWKCLVTRLLAILPRSSPLLQDSRLVILLTHWSFCLYSNSLVCVPVAISSREHRQSCAYTLPTCCTCAPVFSWHFTFNCSLYCTRCSIMVAACSSTGACHIEEQH